MVLRKSSLFNNKRILIIAPHPDDDVIGCGAFLYFLHKNIQSSEVHIAYATSGAGGISGESSTPKEKGALSD